MNLKVKYILSLLISQFLVTLAFNGQDKCHQNGQPKVCLPAFIDAAKNMPIRATSTCGENGPENVCKILKLKNQDGYRQKCIICDSRSKTNSYPTKNMNDEHLINNTYWYSGKITKYAPGNVVNITISIGKTFEVYYVTLEICGTMPHAIALYKSSDNSVTWKAWHYFSRDCYNAFKMPSEVNESMYRYTNLYEATCSPLPEYIEYNPNGCATKALIFNTYNGRKPWTQWSDKLFDWITMTDLKVSLIRLNNELNDPEPEIVHYGLSNIGVGGRCKCNGHAGKCLYSHGYSKCACQHNTDGRDCEKCKPTFLDKPWRRATKNNANACKRCDCHFHSNTCFFHPKLYVKNNYKSGGSCINCQHNTGGRFCEKCSPGYSRDWTKPFRHPNACKPCDCHKIGSRVINDCDRNTGQCKCKEFVTGRQCDKCIDGYSQTDKTEKPCKLQKYLNRSNQDGYYNEQGKIDTANIAVNTSPSCKCDKKRKQIPLKKFCRRPAVFRATVISIETHQDKMRIEFKIIEKWRMKRRVKKLLPEGEEINSVWMDSWRINCYCPKIELGRQYLVLTKAKRYHHKKNPYAQLFLGKRSIVIRWDERWKKRLDKLKLKEDQGECKKFYRRKRRYSKFRSQRRRNRHTNQYNRKPVQKKKKHPNPFKVSSNYGYYGQI